MHIFVVADERYACRNRKFEPLTKLAGQGIAFA